MTLTIVTTPASASANAYCTLADAEAYVATLVWATDWAGKTDEQKKAAIINGARLLDTLAWRGSRSCQAQSMAWPRVATVGFLNLGGFVPNAGGYLLDQDGYQVPSGTVPAVISRANAEMALRLLAEDRAADAGALAPETIQVGTVRLGAMKHQIIPDSVLTMVRPFLRSTGSMVGGPRA